MSSENPAHTQSRRDLINEENLQFYRLKLFPSQELRWVHEYKIVSVASWGFPKSQSNLYNTNSSYVSLKSWVWLLDEVNTRCLTWMVCVCVCFCFVLFLKGKSTLTRVQRVYTEIFTLCLVNLLVIRWRVRYVCYRCEKVDLGVALTSQTDVCVTAGTSMVPFNPRVHTAPVTP